VKRRNAAVRFFIYWSTIIFKIVDDFAVTLQLLMLRSPENGLRTKRCVYPSRIIRAKRSARGVNKRAPEAASHVRRNIIGLPGQQHGRALKRSGYKCRRSEIEKSAYSEEKAGDETKVDQCFA
jgi:hypothetical protein